MLTAGTHPEKGKQGKIRDCSQVQSSALVFREAHDDDADPGSRWKSIHWSESGLMTAVRDKHSSVSTREVHRDRTYPGQAGKSTCRSGSRSIGTMGRQRHS